MKIFKSLPENQGFFDRYAGLVPTLTKIGFLAQIVSAVTEVGILYALVYSAVAEILPRFAPFAGVVGAVVGTAFLEIGLRQFAPYSVRAVLHRRFTGLDLAMTVFIWIVCAGLVASSGLLSFKGSKEIVSTVAPPAKLRSASDAETRFDLDQAAALDQWRADSAEIANRYQAQTAAQVAAFASALELAKAELSRLETLERSSGQKYGSRKAETRLKIKRIEADRDQAAAGLQAQAAAEIANARKGFNSRLQGLTSDLDAARAEVAAANRESEAANAQKIRTWGGGVAWFTVVCLLVFLLSVAISEIHARGSGIEEKALPTPYHFAPGVLAELKAAVSGKFQHFARSHIRRLEESTPPPPLPVVPAALYDLAGLQQYRYAVKMNDQNGTPVIYLDPPTWSGSGYGAGPELERKALSYLQAAEDLQHNNPEAARQMELQAEDVLRAYLEPNATPQAVAELKAAVVAYLQGKGENPFQLNQRRPIGFHTDVERPKRSTSMTVNVYDGQRMEATASDKTRICAHCGQSFAYKHWNARYCSTSCRIQSWEGRTGKKFKAKKS